MKRFFMCNLLVVLLTLFSGGDVIGFSGAFSTIPPHLHTIEYVPRKGFMRRHSTPVAIASEIEKPPIEIIDNVLYPESEYKERMKIGKKAQFENDADGEVSIMSFAANDPRLTLTYHEFPLQSMDKLVNLAAEEYESVNGVKPRTLVDLGSGCGRCVLYAALALDADDKYHQVWDEVHGIEISSLMHNYAVDTVVERGVDKGYLNVDVKDEDTNSKFTKIYFHCGAAEDLKKVLAKADVIFCYSTVFDDDGFSPDIGAMILSKEWSQMLADACKDGTAVVTTDRALNPIFGWDLKYVLEVDNPSLLQSTGYISIRK